MNTKHTALLTIAIAAIACHSPIPEGRYPCATATVTRDCPPSWFCRADHMCWRTPGADAMVPADAMTPADAPTSDAGPHCVAEVCNGTDDDCDGLIDEGVMTVGPAVMATSDGARYLGPAIVGTSGGFGLITATVGMRAATPQWIRLGPSGVPVATPPTLGADLANAGPPFAGVVTPTQVLYTQGAALTTAADRTVFGFDASTGARRTGTTPFALSFSSGRAPTIRAQFVATASDRVTLYASHRDLTVGATPDVIRRFRLDVSRDPPVVLDAREVVTDVVSNGGAWAALGTTAADWIIYYRTTREVVLVAGPSGDGTGPFRTVGVVSGSTGPRLDYASLAIHDPTAPVSPTNPLGVAWEGRKTSTAATPAAFVQVTDTTVFAATNPTIFGDSNGALSGFFDVQMIALLALRDAPAHWLMVNQDTDPAGGGAMVQVREIVGAGATVRRMDVPAEVPTQGEVGIAISGSTIRIAAHPISASLVTRSIGCN